MTKFRYIYICFVLVFLCTSCRDDISLFRTGSVGEDVCLTVPLKLPQMDVKSRANLEDYQTNRVESVWIRTYSASGPATMEEWNKQSNLSLNDTHQLEEVTLSTKTGLTYIVAVANVGDDVMAVTKDNLQPRPLAQLLDEADTWEKFLSIAVVAPSDYYAVDAPSTPLVMAGCYVKNHQELDQWQTVNFEPCQIDVDDDGKFTLEGGAIHLRRIVSQITFNIIPGKDITITPNSYRIVNVPKYSWLYERDSNGGRLPNFGDAATAGNATDFYTDTDLYPSTSFEPGASEGAYTFSFWQAENKHTGTALQYNDRQVKTESDGATLFTSLTGDTWTPNNMATYVVINCNVDYDDQVKINDKGEIGKGDNNAYRSGNADFIIHLGFLGEDAADFNAFRNTKYTYTVTVDGVDKIRVEAYSEGDTNGMEGLVTDVTNPQNILDCHYHAYNIELTPKDLVNLGFIVTTYDNGIAYTYQDIDFKQSDGSFRPLTEQEKLYVDWVQLRPAPGATTLAAYKPATGANADGKTFNLYDAAKGLTDIQKSSSGYYTVFVNEYTYEDDADESKVKDNWKRYVNQPSRRFYIRVTRKISADGKSMYASSKYAGIQRSIQSYYSTRETPPAGGVLGIEHDNEVFGLNVVRNFDDAKNNVNGRHNVWYWLNEGAASIPQSGQALKEWKDVVNLSAMQHIYAVINRQSENNQNNIPEHDALVPALTYPTQIDVTYNKSSLPLYDENSNLYDDRKYWIEAVNACMNRNRDNNGNGKIDADELRWYVPAKDKYLRMLLGNFSLVSPLADYNSVSELITPGKSGKADIVSLKDCTRLMYFSSDGHALISLDGPVTSTWFDDAKTDIASTPWDVRCVRNLGTNLSDVIETDKTTPAYIHDEANRTVTMAYYDSKSYRRSESFSGNGTGDGRMPVHVIHQQRYSKPYAKFQYSEGKYVLNQNNPLKSKYDGYLEEDASQWGIMRPQYSKAITQINDNSLCSDLGDGWRIPNIFELSIMRTIGILDGFYTGSGDMLNREYLISCTTSYYDESGKGYILTPANNRAFLGVTYDNTVQLAMYNGFFERRIYFRCVRDVK